jgi:hypothetical protein
MYFVPFGLTIKGKKTSSGMARQETKQSLIHRRRAIRLPDPARS